MAVAWLVLGSLFAQANTARGALPSTDEARWLILNILGLLGVVVVGIVVIYLVTQWRKRAGAERPSASDQLSEFRTMYDQGQLSREEFERLRSMLGQRMRREMEGPTASAPESRTPAEGPPPNSEPPAPGAPPA